MNRHIDQKDPKGIFKDKNQVLATDVIQLQRFRNAVKVGKTGRNYSVSKCVQIENP